MWAFAKQLFVYRWTRLNVWTAQLQGFSRSIGASRPASLPHVSTEVIVTVQLGSKKADHDAPTYVAGVVLVV